MPTRRPVDTIGRDVDFPIDLLFPAMLHRSKVVTSPNWRERLQKRGLDSVGAVYQLGDGQLITRSGSTEVRRLVLGPPQDAPIVFVKKYWVNRRSQLWSGLLRGTFFGRSKARREFENLRRLREWGIAAPEPIAYGEERKGRWLVRSFLISAGIADPISLDLFIRDRLDRLDPDEGHGRASRRRLLIESLADATRELHAHRFVHHDYFWRNIILSGEQLDRFWLIDAHKGRLWLPFEEEHGRATDLAALDAPAPAYFTRTERLRFFLRYCQRRRLDRSARQLLRLTLRRAAPLREKQRQRVELAGRR